MKAFKKFIVKIFSSWYNNGALKEGAALSFYTVLSLPALVIGIASLATLFLERSVVQEKIVFASSLIFGSTGQEVIRGLVNQLPETGTLTLTTLLSILFLCIIASGIFSSLQDALNAILQTGTAPTNIKIFLKNRLFLFLMVLALGFIFITTTLLHTIFSFAATHSTELLRFSFDRLTLLSSITNFILFVLINAFLFRYLPERKSPWAAVWFGSVVTTILFTLGKFILGTYIYAANIGSAYGAAGSLMALLVWIYYSSQTIFLGAECAANMRVLKRK